MGARDGAGMIPATYERASSIRQALQTMATAGDDSRFIAGGTNLLDLMELQLMTPETLVDVNRLPLDTIERRDDGGLRLGATARNADTAWHPLVERDYPLLSAAMLAAASPQIRNMASNGGNLLQRTRCTYFYDRATPCNKREPGSGCSAIGGLTRHHAILGASEHCIATHPSDMCVALAALDATVHVASVRGERSIPFLDFHRLPGDIPHIDSTLEADELILRIELPPATQYAAHSAYLKIRERLSYAFALVSVAAALDLDEDGNVRSARLALGGVAHKPWRSLEAESLLAGAKPSPATFALAADRLLKGAVSQGQNAFKIPLAHRAIVRALETAAKGTVINQGDAA
ncbi:xanthine dehydrogenase family protein subunit M [Stenotrophomonas aracearum]|uniref:Xanthine dehydrogenase family protein subunit M n=1 Tax=Stenotrophomonas aracearum TaxID=3003272 RepID=A0ABY9Y8C0_9GAMM|nr:xanthine dehydrogenase family protein subunit M [Stenotrophomonas sp. A5588]WNH47104.1 xanthine dehydrogenase family protein subunit M [Stenotrophomonas sp. A5588]